MTDSVKLFIIVWKTFIMLRVRRYTDAAERTYPTTFFNISFFTFFCFPGRPAHVHALNTARI